MQKPAASPSSQQQSPGTSPSPEGSHSGPSSARRDPQSRAYSAQAPMNPIAAPLHSEEMEAWTGTGPRTLPCTGGTGSLLLRLCARCSMRRHLTRGHAAHETGHRNNQTASEPAHFLPRETRGITAAPVGAGEGKDVPPCPRPGPQRNSCQRQFQRHHRQAGTTPIVLLLQGGPSFWKL